MLQSRDPRARERPKQKAAGPEGQAALQPQPQPAPIVRTGPLRGGLESRSPRGTAKARHHEEHQQFGVQDGGGGMFTRTQSLAMGKIQINTTTS